MPERCRALEEVIDDADDVAVAPVTITELRVGALLASSRRRTARSAYLDAIVAAIPVLDYDIDAADADAELVAAVRSQGRPRGAHDLIIAATARSADRTAVGADQSAYGNLPGVVVRSHRA